MGATIQQDTSGVWVIRINGALRKEELDDVQTEWIEALDPLDEGKVLVMVGEDFRGWVGGEVWSDMTFFMRHGDRVGKIAIVCDPKWESRMLMFTGAGLRRALVKYFADNQLSEAFAWLG